MTLAEFVVQATITYTIAQASTACASQGQLSLRRMVGLSPRRVARPIASQLMTTRHPVMPVLDGLTRLLVRDQAVQLGQRHCELATVPPC